MRFAARRHWLEQQRRLLVRRSRRKKDKAEKVRPYVEVLEDRTLFSANPLLDAYGQMALSFEANQGQTAAQVQFVSHGTGYALYLTSTEAVFDLETAVESLSHDAVLRMQLLDANPNATATGLQLLPGKVNYFLGNDPSRWLTDIATFGKVAYDDVYQGIDLVYYGNQRQLEYDFLVAPGADPSAIRLGFGGVQAMTLDAQGNLVLDMGPADVVLRAPVLYQEIDGVRRPVSGSFVIYDDQTVGFDVGPYDNTRELVIDPVLIYSTYLGGQDFDTSNAIAVDGVGSAYVTGRTTSFDFPRPSGGSPPAFSDVVFVSKLNPAGTALEYTTFIGGEGFDVGNGIDVDSAGRAFITGSTQSFDFPTVNGFQSSLQGFGAAFVVRLNSAGNTIEYSSFLGGDLFSEGTAITVNDAGQAFITGSTFGGEGFFPTTTNAFQRFPSGSFDNDAFVAKFNTAGSGASSLLYSTLLGESGDDQGFGIAIDGDGDAYVTGHTDSSSFPTTVNAFDRTPNGGFDAFVAKLTTPDVAGGVQGQLLYATFLGGPGFDEGLGIAVNNQEQAFVTGTSAAGFPVTAGAFDTSLSGGSDAFVTKLNAAGTALLYSTFLGGSSSERGTAIALDSAGQAHVTGSTFSKDFPIRDPIQASLSDPGGGGSFGPPADVFVTKVNAAGNGLIYSTFLGGFEHDEGLGIAVDNAGSAYITGISAPASSFQEGGPQILGGLALGGIAPAGIGGNVPGFQPNRAGGADGFVAKIGDRGVADLAVVKSANASRVAVGDELVYTITVTNLGPSTAFNVVLTDPLPPGTTFLAIVSPPGWAVNVPPVGATGSLVASTFVFAAGESATFVVEVNVATGGSSALLTNTAKVVSSTPDPNLGNNQFTVRTPVDEPVFLIDPFPEVQRGPKPFIVVFAPPPPEPPLGIADLPALPRFRYNPLTMETSGLSGFGEISGVVFEDINASKFLDSAEVGLADWVVFIDTNQNGKYDLGETYTLTNAFGEYRFEALPPDTYTVVVLPARLFRVTMPEDGTYSVTVTLTRANIADVNFGMQHIRLRTPSTPGTNGSGTSPEKPPEKTGPEKPPLEELPEPAALLDQVFEELAADSDGAARSPALIGLNDADADALRDALAPMAGADADAEETLATAALAALLAGAYTWASGQKKDEELFGHEELVETR